MGHTGREVGIETKMRKSWMGVEGEEKAVGSY